MKLLQYRKNSSFPMNNICLLLQKLLLFSIKKHTFVAKLLNMRFTFLSLAVTVIFFSSCQNHSEAAANTATVAEAPAQQSATFQNVNQDDFLKKQNEGAVIIDVRTPEEIAAGYIKGATIFADVHGADFATKINALDKNKTYLVYCRSGRRSATAAQMMVENGFTKVYNLGGGINGWTGETAK